MSKCVVLVAMTLGVLCFAGCGEHTRQVDLPPFRGYALDDLVRRLHTSGLRATYPAASTPCGDGLPIAVIPSPRPPARVKSGSAVHLKFMLSEIPSPAAPLHHARWTRVPPMVGHEFREATAGLVAIWPCVHVRAATATSGKRIVVVAQDPPASTRVRAYGVESKRGYRPTTVALTVAARP